MPKVKLSRQELNNIFGGIILHVISNDSSIASYLVVTPTQKGFLPCRGKFHTLEEAIEFELSIGGNCQIFNVVPGQVYRFY